MCLISCNVRYTDSLACKLRYTAQSALHSVIWERIGYYALYSTGLLLLLNTVCLYRAICVIVLRLYLSSSYDTKAERTVTWSLAAAVLHSATGDTSLCPLNMDGTDKGF